MRHINGAYTTYYNIKQKRTGHLFQGRYKAILVDADCYLSELSRYIHLNAVRAGMVDRPEEYPWSSYASYIGYSTVPEWLKTEYILSLFGNNIGENAKTKYRNFVEDMLAREYVSPLEETVASTILGSEKFVREISWRYLAKRGDERDIPAVKLLTPRLSIDDISDIVNKELTDQADLIRKVSIFFCRKYSGVKLKEIGERFGLSDAAVSQTSHRLILYAGKDQGFAELLNRLDQVIIGVRSQYLTDIH